MTSTKRKRRRVRGRPKRKIERSAKSVGAGIPDDASGEILGKRIIVYGEREDPYKRQRWRIPGGSLVTSDPAEVFRARVEPFSLDSIVSAAAVITRMRGCDENGFVKRLHDAGETRATFHPSIVRRVVTQAIVERELPDMADRTITATEFRRAERVLMDIGAAADRLPEDADPLDIWAALMRIVQHYTHDQLGYGTYVRELWLNRQVVARALERGVDLEDAYRTKLGLTYSELAVLSFAAYAEVIGEDSTGVLDRDGWGVGEALAIAPDTVRAFFDAAGLDYCGFKQWATDPNVVEEGFEAYALSPVVRWPLIMRSDGRYVAPVARDLLERPTRGFAIDVQQVVQSPEESEVVKRVMSSTYEDYVGALLRAALPQATIHRGRDVLPSDRLNCDFVCVEGKLVTLVEVKAVHIRLKADMTKEFDLLRVEFEGKGIGKGLAQLSESARAIRGGVPSLAKNSVLTGLLVVRGEQVLLNSQEVRSLIEELAAAEVECRFPVKYQVLNDEGLIVLGRIAAAEGGLGKAVRKKLDDSTDLQKDFEDFAAERLNAESPRRPSVRSIGPRCGRCSRSSESRRSRAVLSHAETSGPITQRSSREAVHSGMSIPERAIASRARPVTQAYTSRYSEAEPGGAGMRTTKDYPETVGETELLAGGLPETVKEGNRMLPAWLTERMMTDTWSFGLLTGTGHLICISHISAISQDEAGDLWLDVELLEGDSLPGTTPQSLPRLFSPTSRTTASVAVRHIVAAFELADT